EGQIRANAVIIIDECRVLQEAEWNAVVGAHAALSGNSAIVSAGGRHVEQILLQVDVVIVAAGALYECPGQDNVFESVSNLYRMAAHRLGEVFLDAEIVCDLARWRIGIRADLQVEVVEGEVRTHPDPETGRVRRLYCWYSDGTRR